MSSASLDLPASWGCCGGGGDSCLRQNVERVNLIFLLTKNLGAGVSFFTLPINSRMIWGKSHSRSPYKMGLIIPALSFSKDRYKVRMRKKNQVRGGRRVEITLPLSDLILTLPFVDFSDGCQPPEALLPAASLFWRFILRKVLFSSLYSWLWSHPSKLLCQELH